MQVLKKHLSGELPQQSSSANGSGSNGAVAPQRGEQTGGPSQQARAADAAASGGEDWFSQARQGQGLRDYIAAEASKLEAVTRDSELPHCFCFNIYNAALQASPSNYIGP